MKSMNLEETIRNNYTENSTSVVSIQDYDGKTSLSLSIKEIFQEKTNLLNREVAWFGYVDQENGTKKLTFILNGKGL